MQTFYMKQQEEITLSIHWIKVGLKYNFVICQICFWIVSVF